VRRRDLEVVGSRLCIVSLIGTVHLAICQLKIGRVGVRHDVSASLEGVVRCYDIRLRTNDAAPCTFDGPLAQSASFIRAVLRLQLLVLLHCETN